jgi:hypothetical protein
MQKNVFNYKRFNFDLKLVGNEYFEQKDNSKGVSCNDVCENKCNKNAFQIVNNCEIIQNLVKSNGYCIHR